MAKDVAQRAHMPQNAAMSGSRKMPPIPEPGICALCHGQGLGCCVLEGASTEKVVGMTRGEARRIATACGRPMEEFCLEDEISPQFEAHINLMHPVLNRIMPGRRRLRLKVDENGACVFLGQDGCTLPREDRPLFCRLFPFWFTPDARLALLETGSCLAQREAASLDEVLARLGEREDNLRTLFARLIRLAHEDG